MKSITEKQLLGINLIFIAIEVLVVVLSKLEILAFEYGWDSRINITILITVILIQIFFMYLISRSEGEDNRKRHYIAQIVLIVCIAIWIFMNIEIHYKIK